MPQPRTPYQSATRGMRTSAKPPQPPSVPSPVGAQTSTTAGGQAAVQASALRSGSDSPSLFQSLSKQDQDVYKGAYASGGFEGVAKSRPDWYDLPESVRTQILAGSRE